MAEGDDPTLADIEAAAARIAPSVRPTPTIPWIHRPPLPGLRDEVQVVLKLEFLQRGGSFKVRGAHNALALAAEVPQVLTASGGNHGIGVALAARQRGIPTTVFLPETAPQGSEDLLYRLGARVVRAGASWDDAYALCREEAERVGALLIHPFDDPAVIAGQGTVGLELLEQVPGVDLVLVAVGGGGLIAGVATAVHGRGARRPGGPVRVLGVQTEGADAMARSLAAGHPVRLPRVCTIAGTLAPRTVSARTLRICQRLIGGVVLVSDDHLRAAQQLLWDDLRLRVEPAGAATLAALLAGRLGDEDVRGVNTIALLLCGANGQGVSLG